MSVLRAILPPWGGKIGAAVPASPPVPVAAGRRSRAAERQIVDWLRAHRDRTGSGEILFPDMAALASAVGLPEPEAEAALRFLGRLWVRRSDGVEVRTGGYGESPPGCYRPVYSGFWILEPGMLVEVSTEGPIPAGFPADDAPPVVSPLPALLPPEEPDRRGECGRGTCCGRWSPGDYCRWCVPAEAARRSVEAHQRRPSVRLRRVLRRSPLFWALRAISVALAVAAISVGCAEPGGEESPGGTIPGSGSGGSGVADCCSLVRANRGARVSERVARSRSGTCTGFRSGPAVAGGVYSDCRSGVIYADGRVSSSARITDHRARFVLDREYRFTVRVER